MDRALSNADAVIHLAAINRGAPDDVILANNTGLAESLIRGIRRSGKRIPVVHANSIHAGNGTAFGHSKATVAKLFEASADALGVFADVLLPNIFGEHGRPNYNSFVATFCSLLAAGQHPESVIDRPIALLHAQNGARTLVDLALAPRGGEKSPVGHSTSVLEVLELLKGIAEGYRTGHYPDLQRPFVEALFNTYRSFTFPQQFPIYPDAMTDPRGRLVEAVRANGGEAQVFFSATRPGMTRGEHFHLRKVERFLVLRGTASIRLRRLFFDEVITFKVSGDQPAIVDMPTMWAHSISNTGDEDLLTLFYADQCFNPQSPDTFVEKV
jgi:UDP-2-acetamido-2,6-beta-L-arabino-hexul-4-ose reductase